MPANPHQGDLLKAAKSGTASEVSAAIANGADPNARDRTGWTPLHWAAFHNPEPSVVAALIAYGADPNARDGTDRTPLHRAMFPNLKPSVVMVLIKLGAKLDACDKDGKTPFDYYEHPA